MLLTCENVVIVVDIVEFDPFIQDMKLVCRQHLPLPVRVTYIMTGQRSNTLKSDMQGYTVLKHIHTSASVYSGIHRNAGLWTKPKSIAVAVMSQFR